MLYLYQMDPVLIHQSRPLGDAWLGDLQGYLDNFRTPLVRILYGRRRLKRRDPGIVNFQLWSIGCICNVVCRWFVVDC